MIPEGTTFWGVVLKQFLVGASAFAIGIMLYRTLFFERRRHRPFLATGFFGMAIALGLVAEAIIRSPLINPDFRALLYLVAMLMIFIGFTGDAVRQHRRDRGNQDRRRSIQE